MPRETMTPRERWEAVLSRQTPDRVPLDYRATPEATAKLLKHMGCANLEEALARLHVDRLMGVSPKYVGPAPPTGTDIWGCRFEDVDYGTGVYPECVYSPLARYETVEQIERAYRWPSPDWYDYSGIPSQVAGKEAFPITGGGSEPFLIYKNLRGMEQAFLDLVLHPDIVHYLLGRLYDFAYEETARVYEQIPGRVLITGVSEDMGGQHDLMYSPDQIRGFFMPHFRRMIGLVHEAGARVMHHTDGASRKILPDMIAAGIDVLDPVQWRCTGMEREGLKRDFGDRVIFHGGLDNQYTLPFGTVDEVRQEVLDNYRILGADGGYIVGPCHNIQAVSPPENVVAMYETAYEHGWR